MLLPQVRPADWREALAGAPQPCSRRQGLAAMAAEHAQPLPHHLAPLLLPALESLLGSLAASCLPLPPAAAATIDALRGDAGGLEPALQGLGAVAGAPTDCGEPGLLWHHQSSTPPAMMR